MPDTLNRAAIEQLRDLGGDDFVRQMVAVFLEEAQQNVDRLSGVSPHATDTVRFEAHALKGSAANLGAEALSSLAATMENAARDGDPTTVASALQRLPAVWQATRAALNAL